MGDFKAGDRVRIVEYDPVTREPKPGGFCYPAWVSLEGPYAYGHRTDPGDTSGLPYRFMADTGWGALDGYDIRLLPATGEEAATAAGREASMPNYDESPSVHVEIAVAVDMTPGQRAAYAERYGVGFVEVEVAARLRQSLNAADLGWLREFATVAVSDTKKGGGND